MKNRLLTALTAGLFAFVLVGCQPSNDDDITQEEVVEEVNNNATHEQAIEFIGLEHEVRTLYYDSKRAYEIDYPQTCHIKGSEEVVAYARQVVNKSLLAYWDGQLQNLSDVDKAFVEAVAWQEDFLAAYQRSLTEYQSTKAAFQELDKDIYDFEELYTYDKIQTFLERGREAMKKHKAFMDELTSCKPYNNIVRAAVDVYEAQNTLQ